MGGINRALNRTSFRSKSTKPFFRKWDANPERVQQREERINLKLITLSSDQQNRQDLKFVYDLPQSIKEVKKVLRKAKDEEDKLVIIQRIRDYYNPLLDPNNNDKYRQFIIYLLAYFIQKDSTSQSLKQHLQELCSENGALFSAFLKSKLTKIVQLIKDFKSNGTTQLEELPSLDKVLTQVIESQQIVQYVFECPNNSKLLEILEQTVSYIYQMSNLFMKNDSELLLKIVEQDISICYQLNKKFNPSITMIMIKLLEHSKENKALGKNVKELYSKYLLNFKDMPAFQILTVELNKVAKQAKVKIVKKPEQKLEFLQMQKKKLKELPSFAPFIDEEFLMLREKKFKKEDDEKEVKRKFKKAEKDALRELRKDTIQIQVQKNKEQGYRNNLSKKSIVRAGNIKDEI